MELAHRKEVTPAKPFHVRQDMGKRLFDFVWDSMIPLVHDRVVDLLKQDDVTGWGVYPIQLFDKEGALVPNYNWGLSISGRCGPTYLDKEHSAVVYQEMPGGRFPQYQGLYVPTESWDGSDIFLSANGTGWKLITGKVRELFLRASVSNVMIEPISEVRMHATDQPRFPKGKDS
jgi:hypothetical protein